MNELMPIHRKRAQDKFKVHVAGLIGTMSGQDVPWDDELVVRHSLVGLQPLNSQRKGCRVERVVTCDHVESQAWVFPCLVLGQFRIPRTCNGFLIAHLAW